MKCEKLLVLAVILSSPSLVMCKKSRPCRADQHEYYNKDMGCKKCDKCPPGKQRLINDKDIEHDPEHGAMGCYSCEECKPGTYKDRRSYDKCSPCATCANLDRKTETNCTAQRNAVCGQCLPGFHDIYKFLYKSSVPQRDKSCQSCKFDKRGVPECQDFHAKSIDSKTWGHDSSTKTQPSTSTSLDEHSEEMKVNEAIQQTNSNNGHGSSSILYLLLAIIVLMCLVLFVVMVALKWKSSPCRHQVKSVPVSDPEVGKSTQIHVFGHKEGNSNSSFTPGVSTEYVSGPGEKLPLLPDDVTTDSPEFPEEKDTSRKSAVANPLTDFCLVQQMIGKEWKNLARLLGILEADIEKLEMNYSDASERIFQLLLTWKKRQGESATISCLCKALKGVGRHDVAIKLMQNITS